MPITENQRRISYINPNDYEDDITDSDKEEVEDVKNKRNDRSEEKPELWDSFIRYPPKIVPASTQQNRWINNFVIFMKILIYGLLFIVVLVGSILVKMMVLFATSQLGENKTVTFCPNDIGARTGITAATISNGGRIMWTWCIIFMFAVPECFAILHTVRYFFFKKFPKIQSMYSILSLFLMETCHVIGIALLVFIILPSTDAVSGAMITNCVCLIPGLLALLSRNSTGKNIIGYRGLYFTGDIAALLIQISGIFPWHLLDTGLQEPLVWVYPLALVLSSCRWWYNYVSSESSIGIIRLLAAAKKDLSSSRHIMQGIVGLYRIVAFLGSAVLILLWNGIEPNTFFETLKNGTYEVNLVQIFNSTPFSKAIYTYDDYSFRISSINDYTMQLAASFTEPLYVFLIQAVCAMIVYQFAKFAYRTLMHQFGFAAPINMSVLGTVSLLITFSILRDRDVCAFDNIIPNYLFFTLKTYRSAEDFFFDWHVWIWLAWLLSQAWITMHVWKTEPEKMAQIEKIFSVPTYDSLIIDQSLALSRRRHEETEDDDIPDDVPGSTIIPGVTMNTRGMFDGIKIQQTVNPSKTKKNRDNVTRIYACATMWHEEKEEMMLLISSILRLDKEQGLMRALQKSVKMRLSSYYELETHVFFDDAFECIHGCFGACAHEDNEIKVNEYVTKLIKTVETGFENLAMRPVPPVKYPTPYGGRLIWELPAKTKLIVHLKDKNKIRHRKRWSQVMYMYYLLGYRLMGLPVEDDRKDVIAENTYILTLDGDIDFQPPAVKSLVELMKKDPELGAACGRIHPVGSGPMVWFQKFEYAIGHWLQKSTEHTIGCVLCCPGCFSLFRAKALMQPNVMAKYATESTEPRHYVQFDQGEDRWLCTLLLQFGCRIEYSAASDAYTHAPESFNTFYVQRRRWIPSTVANILDLLNTSKETRKVNENISMPYILYQWVLMGSTILGPGTIFLMLVGAFVSAFRIGNWISFAYNLIPISIFVAVCVFCNEKVQLITAAIITAVYDLVMIVVLVGIMLQISEDGWFAPGSLLFFVVAVQVVIAGLLHPQEWLCLLSGFMYYINVPSMYMVLIIFSIFNVNNVTWGTREKKGPEQQNPEEQQPADTNKPEANNKKQTKAKGKTRGTFEFSFAGLFKCFFCTTDAPTKEEQTIEAIQESLKRINARLDVLQRGENVDTSTHSVQPPNGDYGRHAETYSEGTIYEKGGESRTVSRNDDCIRRDSDTETDIRTQISATSNRARSNYLVSPYWLQDEEIGRGEVEFLSPEEETFWKSLIVKYLSPLDKDDDKEKKIAEELLHLRNDYLFKFFMINALFVLIIFLMQLNKAALHLPWPLDIKYNVTYIEEGNEVHISKEYLLLEPIGCLFIAGFVSILGIQFVAMFFHRFDTFSHILSNTRLCTRISNQSDDKVIESRAQDILNEVRRRADDEVEAALGRTSVIFPGRRKTRLLGVAEQAQGPRKPFGNFQQLFREKLDEIGKKENSSLSSRMSKRVATAFENRRSMLVQQRRSQFRKPTADDIYDSTHIPRHSNLNGQVNMRPVNENHRGYDNGAFNDRDEANL